MKQLKWIIGLGVTAAVLCGVYLVVDYVVSDKEKREKLSGPKTLFSFDSTDVNQIRVNNEDGEFLFNWDFDDRIWKMTAEDDFYINSNAISTICNFFCNLKSEKTVVADCEDPSPFGFDNPVTLRVYTTETEDNPYTLYVGDCTPTYDAFYVMVEGSKDVYTIDYYSGSVFCVAKDTLKDVFLYDADSPDVTYYRLEHDGKTEFELTRDKRNIWGMTKPMNFPVDTSAIDNMIENLVRATVEGYVEENPADLAQYGLDKPAAKLFIKGKVHGEQRDTEIWFGKMCSDDLEETEMYGYFAGSKNVFRILKSYVTILDRDAFSYVLPYCANVDIEEIDSLHVDLGEIYDINNTFYVDYANGQYSFDDIDITALDDSDIMDKYQTFYRAVSTLSVTEIDMGDGPASDEGSVAEITYHLKDGSQEVLRFVPASDNTYYLMVNGKYSHEIIRLNRFTGTSGITKSYEALKRSLDSLKK